MVNNKQDTPQCYSVLERFAYITWFYHLCYLEYYFLFFRPKRFTLKAYKRLYFICKNLYMLAYKSAEAARSGGELQFSVHLKGCEVRTIKVCQTIAK